MQFRVFHYRALYYRPNVVMPLGVRKYGRVLFYRLQFETDVNDTDDIPRSTRLS
ncbi:unnamed protein product [Ceutorhynchus assimilis]|uniref:Uncharacterized protein n=1 Tax=Ceutorhynchus assimilis TaxID=467358 RepID=A0A9N9MDS6_9CUCU|nr:unnamed protein product [Ceutorhynchus assimilis]